MLTFPLNVTQGALAVSFGPQAIMEKITLLIGTPQGARSLVPEYGCPALPTYDADVPTFTAELAAVIQTFIPEALKLVVSGALVGSTVEVNVTFEYGGEVLSRDYFLN